MLIYGKQGFVSDVVSDTVFQDKDLCSPTRNTDTTHILWWALSHAHCSVMKHLLTYFMTAELAFCMRIS